MRFPLRSLAAGLCLLPLLLRAAKWVDLDATALPSGPLATWDNTVDADPANDFVRAGPGTAGVGPVGTPAVQAVTFGATANWYVGPEAPVGMTSAGPRSIEVWVLNPDLAAEETLVAWSRRGGPDGTNLSFNYGNNATYGAVGHWGPPDMGWGTPPAANEWHHLVYTYDGTRAKVYADGVLKNDQARTLLTYFRNPTGSFLKFVVGAQNFPNGTPGEIPSTLSLAKVRIHDTALSPLAVQELFNAEAAQFGKTSIALPPAVVSFTATPSQPLPGQPVSLSWSINTAASRPLTSIDINQGVGAVTGNTGSTNVVPAGATTYTITAANADGSASASVYVYARAQPLVARHRWHFNETGTAINGFALADSLGGSNAFIRTNGAILPTLSGSQVVLPGGASATAPYIDLPNGIVSQRSGDATFETWVTLNGLQAWSRIFDFGSSFANGGNEITAPGGAGNGEEYLVVSAQIGGDPLFNRFELRDNNVPNTVDIPVPYTAGQAFQAVVVYKGDGSAAGGPQLRYYRNGALLGTLDTTFRLNQIRDINNWLGRSNWMADANTQGSYDEMRVYDGAMHADDVAVSFAAGPDVPTLPAFLHIDLFGADRYTLNEGESVALHWAVTHPSGTLHLSLDQGIGALPAASGVTNLSPSATTTYVLTATNGGATRTSALTVTVQSIRPAVTSASHVVPFNGSVATALTATDPRGLPLTWTVLTPPVHGSLSGTAPNLTYTAGPGYSGADSFVLQADNGEAVGSGTVSLLVQGDAPVAFDQTLSVPFETPRALLLTAHDPDGEALTWSILAAPTNGVLSGTAPNLVYTPDAGTTGGDLFTFRANDGSFSSNTGTVSIVICPATPPVDITLSDLFLRVDEGPGTLVARLQAVDPGCGDRHTFALVAGTGDTHNARFSVNGNQLLSAHDFSGELGQSISLRLRATDETGAAFEKEFTLPVLAADLHVLIHEIYYNSPLNGLAAEFVELHNPLPAPVDIGGWRFTRGITYTFPTNTVIAAGGYRVVAQDPAVIASLYGVTALGPWAGKLSNDGDTVELRDLLNVRVDEVAYGIAAPWPVPANGDGPSLELVNPGLDNDLGGHWQASTAPATATTYFSKGSGGWRYRPGVSAASSPALAWTAAGFAEDGSWLTGTTPIGLFKLNDNNPVPTFAETGVTLGTQLVAANTGGAGDMATYVAANAESDANYTVAFQSVFFRKTFTVTGTPPSALFLRVMHNDAAIVHLNGTEVARFGFAPNAPAEPAPGFADVYESGNDPWSETLLTNLAGVLTTGTNVLAIQGWANNPRLRGGPNGQDSAAEYNVFDFCVDAELSTPGQFQATPGAANSVFASNGTPAVRQVDHGPNQPIAGQPIRVTARVSDRQGLGAVTLNYQVVAPGNFIPAELPRTNAEILANIVANPDYPRLANADFESPANWISLPMTDDGASGGDTAGDGVFTAVLPPQSHRSLVRYRIEATDLAGNTVRVPAANDPARNFACFVYNGVPAYVNGGTVILPPDLESLPVYHWLMRSGDFDQLMAYNGADQFANNKDLNVLMARRFYNFEGSLVVDGKVHDHVHIRLRGGNSRYLGAGKRHFRFKFPKGSPFLAKDEKGRAYPQPWEDMLFNKLFGNNGPYDWGLPYLTGGKLWELQGVPTPFNHFVHFRVIRNAAEAASPTTGDFFGLYQALELPDGKNFLAARDLPPGNFYKMSDYIQNGEMDERYQAPGAPLFAEDFDNVRYNIHPATPQVDFERDVNMPLYYRYNAVQEAIRHYDIFIEPTGRHRIKNLYWYFHPGPLNPDGSRVHPFGQCWYMPYDWDASFGPNYNNGYDNVNNALYNRNAIPDSPTWGAGVIPDRTSMRVAHRNAIREMRDLVFYRDASGTGPVDDILNDGVARLDRFWRADNARWANLTGASVADLPGGPTGKANDMRAFCFTGWAGANGPAVGAGGRAAYLDSISDALDAGQLPSTPVVAYSGPPGAPLDALTFTVTPFADPQGAGTFAAVQWRAGEITDSFAPAHDPAADRLYEAATVWTSGELTNTATTLTLPASVLREGHTYRIRARYKDSTGRFGHWSAPVTLTPVSANAVATLTENLVISEILYKPAPLTVEEGLLGYVENDFEFVELQNRSNLLTLSLDNLRFTKGVDFDFPAGLALTPGETILVVRNAAAFAHRNGPGHALAGEWEAGQSLNNGGEQLKLSYGAGDAVHDLDYSVLAPWPVAGGDGGVSIVYVGPDAVHGQPDPQASGANWRASAIPGGTPGADEHLVFTRWLAERGETNPLAPSGIDAWDNLSAFAFARDLGVTNLWGEISVAPGDDFAVFTYTRRRGVVDLVFTEEISPTLLPPAWTVTGLNPVSTTDHGDGTETLTFHIPAPLGTGPRAYVRVRVDAPSL